MISIKKNYLCFGIWEILSIFWFLFPVYFCEQFVFINIQNYSFDLLY